MPRERREKLSDQQGRLQPFLGGQRVPFLEAFPDLETLELTVTEHGMHGPEHTTRVTDQRFFSVVDCSNAVCGGVEPYVREAIRARAETVEYSKMCEGYEGSPKGRRKYRKCLNTFQVTHPLSTRRGIRLTRPQAAMEDGKVCRPPLAPYLTIRPGRFALTRQALDTLSAASVGSLDVG